MLKGKQGRFRQTSGGWIRSFRYRCWSDIENVSMVCHEMAIELFKPFVMREIAVFVIVYRMKAAKRMVCGDERNLGCLEDVIKRTPFS